MLPLGTIIALVIQYGPQIIAFLEAVQPLLKAAQPVVAKLVESGMSPEDAQGKVIGWMAAPHKMSEKDVEFWRQHGIDDF